MRVYITKDCFDGSESKIIEADLDGMSMSSLIFMLMGGKVASLTITKKFDIEKAIAKANPEAAE